jgi:glycosyltransferase involved in cell wall biosynthesis
VKVLLLSYHPPVPPAGDHVLPAHVARLASHVEFIWLSLVRSEAEGRQFRDAMGPHCGRIETVVSPMSAGLHDPAGASPASLWCGARNVLSAAQANGVWQTMASAPTAFYYSSAYAARLRALVAEEQPDVVHFQDMATSTHWKDVPADTFTVWCPVDAISRWFHEGWRTAAGPVERWSSHARFLETRAWERVVIPRFDRTIVVSDSDARWLRDVSPAGQVHTIPLCVDTDYFRPQVVVEDHPSILFTGIFTYAANREALAYFARDILPRVRREVPEVKLVVVGKDPDASVRALGQDRRNVVTEWVDDIRPVTASATVSVAPMRSGTGVKLKVLRAMAMGRAVVATSHGADGVVGARDEDTLCIADSPDRFAAQVVALLRSPEQRQRLGERARASVVAHHSVDRWAERFLQIYKGAA